MTELVRETEYENPINSLQDLMERNITILLTNVLYFDNFRDFYLSLNTPEWDYVANNMVLPTKDCWNGTRIPINICSKTSMKIL